MTILREAEHSALRKLELSGKVLDLGGDRRSSYRNLFRGFFSLTTVNLASDAQPDIVADLEKPLPIPDASFDGVLLINLLEHVFEYHTLLAESRRVLIPGGKIVIIVPYIFPHHPSPDDYHRYSASALRRMLSDFSDVQIVPLGSGVFSARLVLLERLIPAKVQSMLALITHPLATLCDSIFSGLARALHRKYEPSDYALGFLVTAYKPRS
jgi:SAM-dependent methyltransferase